LFQEVLCINPRNWSALWLLGKIHQRLDDYEAAFRYFAQAHRLSPAEPDVAREASIAAMELGRPLEAVPIAERAVAAKPSDAGLRANLALTLLFAQRAREALAVAEDALCADPGDEITARIVAMAREVVSGNRPCPRHVRDLE
jgi:Flp pilus assembly protein TadD